METSFKPLQELANTPMTDKEVVLRLIEMFNRGDRFGLGLNDFINVYIYIVKQVNNGLPIDLKWVYEGSIENVTVVIPS